VYENTEWKISSEIPTAFHLDNNYPNPFYQSTSIIYSIPLKAKVTIMLFDTWGREIATLVNQEVASWLAITCIKSNDCIDGNQTEDFFSNFRQIVYLVF
jgi:hypothetical protein